MNDTQLLNVSKAFKKVLKNRISFSTETIHIKESIGRILAESVKADRDFPPFDRVMADGIAIKYEAFKEGKREFKIAGMQVAGSMQQQLSVDTDCIEVMTGAVLPMAADTIVKAKDVVISNGYAKITVGQVEKGQLVHTQGYDCKRNDEVISKGTRISSAEVAIFAAVGKRMVEVLNQPRIAIISTGDELVEIDDLPAPHQIRKSNSYALQAALDQEGIPTDRFHLKYEREDIFNNLSSFFEEYDVIMISGGIYDGRKNLFQEVLAELKVKNFFHKVAQTPGHSTWFGKKDKSLVFGYPANSVSAFLCFYRYFLPWLRESQGQEYHEQKAVLAEDVTFESQYTYFLQVRLELDEKGNYLAHPEPGNGPGDITSLSRSDGFVELPGGQMSFKKGETYPLFRYRN